MLHRFTKKTMVIAVMLTATLGGVALTSQSVLASLNATAFNTTAQSISTATLKLTQAASGQAGLTAGFTTAVTGVAPGDTINRFIDLTNGGTMNGQLMTIKLADATNTVLTTDPVNGLQVVVTECSVAFTATTGACSGTTTTDLASTSANAIAATAQALTVSSTAAGAVVHLKFAISLPAGSETTANGVLPLGTVQGLTSTLTWTFSETQRLATNTNA